MLAACGAAVLPTPPHPQNITFISVINQLDAQNFCFTISLFHASTCFKNMCSKHVEAWNKLIVKQKFCAARWLITEMHGQKNVKISCLLQPFYLLHRTECTWREIRRFPLQNIARVPLSFHSYDSTLLLRLRLVVGTNKILLLLIIIIMIIIYLTVNGLSPGCSGYNACT